MTGPFSFYLSGSSNLYVDTLQYPNKQSLQLLYLKGWREWKKTATGEKPALENVVTQMWLHFRLLYGVLSGGDGTH